MQFSASNQFTHSHHDLVWSQLAAQMNPFTQILVIPGAIFRACDAAAKKHVVLNFQFTVNAPVMFCRDGTADRYYLGPPGHFAARGVVFHVEGSEPFWVSSELTVMGDADAGETTVKKTGSEKKTEKIPRPPNAYILYRKDRHGDVKAACPGITNNEISQVLGAAWNNETPQVRQKYKQMSDERKKRLLEEHPDYQYRPRKPSEKKRRRQAPNGST